LTGVGNFCCWLKPPLTGSKYCAAPAAAGIGDLHRHGRLLAGLSGGAGGDAGGDAGAS